MRSVSPEKLVSSCWGCASIMKAFENLIYWKAHKSSFRLDEARTLIKKKNVTNEQVQVKRKIEQFFFLFKAFESEKMTRPKLHVYANDSICQNHCYLYAFFFCIHLCMAHKNDLFASLLPSKTDPLRKRNERMRSKLTLTDVTEMKAAKELFFLRCHKCFY